MLGFEAKPHLRTVVASLDLSSAYNRVDHDELLNIFCKLDITPVYGLFYKGFLEDRIFRVRCGNAFSKWKKESCGTPQGTISSPLLFLIYMEDFLRSTLPAAERMRIAMAMYADDLTVWKTGLDITQMAQDLSEFISNSVDPWVVSHNMLLSVQKCHSFLFSQYYRDCKPCIILNGIKLSYGSDCDHSYLCLLGVHLDSRLSFLHHLAYMRQKAGLRLHQLSRVSNTIYGLDQADLVTMYIAYIRSILEYVAPVWYQCMSQISISKLQILQN